MHINMIAIWWTRAVSLLIYHHTRKRKQRGVNSHSQPKPRPRSTQSVCACVRVFVRVFVCVLARVLRTCLCVSVCVGFRVVLSFVWPRIVRAGRCLLSLGVSPFVLVQRLHLLAKHTKSLLWTPCLEARSGSPGAEDAVWVVVLVHREIVEELRAAHVDGLLVLRDDHVDDRRQLANAKTGGEVCIDDLGKRDLRILGGGLSEELVRRVFLLAVLDASVCVLLEKSNDSVVVLSLPDQAVEGALVLYVYALCCVGIVILAADVGLGALHWLSLLRNLVNGAAAADVDTPLEIDHFLGADGRDRCGQRGCDDEKSGSLHGLRLLMSF